VGIDVDAFKDGQRQVWSAGDYPDVARTIEEVAHVVVERSGAGPSMEMLDVATGSGNVAIPAAASGASVTALDLTPKLLEVAAARAAEAGVEVRWVEGDAEALPFADASFDRVTSCFGVIFAPRHRVSAAELVRVARPGARIVVTGWTPGGLTGQFFKTTAAYMPPPPPELETPLQWGEEEHVRSLFQDSGASVSFQRRTVTFAHDSPESWFEFQERTLGPMVLAKAALEPQGRWAELRAEMIAFYSEHNEAEDGTFRAPAEYLLSVAELPG